MPRKEFETLTPQMFYILLSLKKPRHGYEIMQSIQTMTDGQLTVGAGTLYTLLSRFQNDNYIDLIGEENRKKIYLLSPLGEKKLKSEYDKMMIMLKNYTKLFEEED